VRQNCPHLLQLQADMLSSPLHHCMRYLISHSKSAGELRELFDCPVYESDMEIKYV